MLICDQCLVGYVCFMFVCLLVFVCLVICFVCLFDYLFDCLLLITFCLTIFAGRVRQYKSMQSMSHDWETVKTVAHETVRHMT